MTRRTMSLLATCSIALATACGGTEINESPGDSGEEAGALSPESGVTVDAEAPSATDATVSTAPDAGGFNISCMSAQNCARNQVCCAALSTTGVTVACANRCAGTQYQLCMSDSECPTGEACMASRYGASYCAAAPRTADAGARRTVDAGLLRDAGPSNDAESTDAGSLDGGSGDDGSTDAPVDGAPLDAASTDGALADAAPDDGGPIDTPTDAGVVGDANSGDTGTTNTN